MPWIAGGIGSGQRGAAVAKDKFAKTQGLVRQVRTHHLIAESLVLFHPQNTLPHLGRRRAIEFRDDLNAGGVAWKSIGCRVQASGEHHVLVKGAAMHRINQVGADAAEGIRIYHLVAGDLNANAVGDLANQQEIAGGGVIQADSQGRGLKDNAIRRGHVDRAGHENVRTQHDLVLGLSRRKAVVGDLKAGIAWRPLIAVPDSAYPWPVPSLDAALSDGLVAEGLPRRFVRVVVQRR